VNHGSPDVKLPDVVGTVTRAQSSPASLSAAKEIAQIGQFICNSQSAQFHEKGIIHYAQAVTELDIDFLEQVRKEVCLGLDTFMSAANAGSTMSKKQVRRIQAR
jgi:hypothetical protein